ncbi:copine-9-like [Actinia tenebrosa]|uniref:Copine-9-like n=1 Tax=Actinia tenebrosa TaxID=6105 RepID=A0A6P8IGV5_ACTTE|nr:copine-9-like [Actinia tenebrosa]
MAKVGTVDRPAPNSVYQGSFSKNTSAFQSRRKIEIFIECNDLIQLEKFSKSDPLCVLHVKKLGNWTEYGRTESLPNNLNPKFVESFIIDGCPLMYPRLRFSLYDLANFTSKDLRKHDFIGSVEVDFGTLLTSESPLVRTLRIPGDITTRGFINIFFEDVVTSMTNVRVQMRGENLQRPGFLSKCDAFFAVERLLQSGHFHPVYRSEIVTRTQDPKWAPFELYLQKLCNEDVKKEAQISCWHYSSNGAHTLIGRCKFDISEVLGRKVKILNLIKPTKPGKSSKRPSSSGLIRVLSCHVDRIFSLLDYIRGGCQIRMACALDFTLSNGEPSSSNSLHCMAHEQNQYIRTIEALGPILTYYDQEKRIPSFGFGAKNMPGPYCFAMNQQQEDPDVVGVEALINIYSDLLSTIKLGGPTYLAPVIERIADYAKKEVSQESQYYVVALVIMDGVANDIDSTINKLAEISTLPLSIIVAGVGPADFSCMEELLNSRRKLLRTRDTKELQRENTYFIALPKHYHNHERNVSAAREALAHISRQIVSFFKSRKIDPNPPQTTNIEAVWAESRDTNGISFSSMPSTPRTRKIMSTQNPRCPTCGSLLEK